VGTFVGTLPCSIGAVIVLGARDGRWGVDRDDHFDLQPTGRRPDR
jgi:hypothetical protein